MPEHSGNASYLDTAARQEMIQRGFEPDFPPEAIQQLAIIRDGGCSSRARGETRDLRDLPWSSIDNDTSRDLDQIEVAERRSNGEVKLLVGIADVDACVSQASPIDGHAALQTTTVYTGVTIFPMLPLDLSADLTSLLEGEDRLAMVVELIVAEDGSIRSCDFYRARVRNHAQLTYRGAGEWLEDRAGPPPQIARAPELQDQLRLQDQAAQKLRQLRHERGALDVSRVEAQAVFENGRPAKIAAVARNRASELIEDLMIAVNVSVARVLEEQKVASIRRVVKTPERWNRLVDLAARYGFSLPEQPDPGALNRFLIARKKADPVHYPDVSLAVVKLLGPGEYVVERPGDPGQGHFGLAVHDYTHSTAPNRRFADLVTQRLLKAVLAKQPPPYTADDLDGIARNCTLKEDAARKVERSMAKRIAAVALHDRVGQVFSGVVTGVTPKGTFVRVFEPPVEGRVVRGEQGLDVGDTVSVKLVATDPQHGYIDFVH
jgi:VacB/RNase II family 3'-5' exoribonuclease